MKKFGQLLQQMKNAKKKWENSKQELIAANSQGALTECTNYPPSHTHTPHIIPMFKLTIIFPSSFLKQPRYSLSM